MFDAGAFDVNAFSESAFNFDTPSVLASFSLAPSSVSALGLHQIVATGVGTDWDAGDPFSVQSGSATLVLDSYDNDSATSATFSIDVFALDGPIVIRDADSETTCTIWVRPAALAAMLANVGQLMNR